ICMPGPVWNNPAWSNRPMKWEPPRPGWANCCKFRKDSRCFTSRPFSAPGRSVLWNFARHTTAGTNTSFTSPADCDGRSGGVWGPFGRRHVPSIFPEKLKRADSREVLSGSPRLRLVKWVLRDPCFRCGGAASSPHPCTEGYGPPAGPWRGELARRGPLSSDGFWRLPWREGSSPRWREDGFGTGNVAAKSSSSCSQGFDSGTTKGDFWGRLIS